MFDEKGPVTAINVLAHGIVDLFTSPIIFIIRYIAHALLLPIYVLAAFFDFSTP